MPNTVASTYMNLPIPVVGTDPGPDWATNINNCLTLIDQHDHSSGYGNPVTPAGLNINSDLSFGSNNATALRSARLTQQSAVIAGASDLSCAYDVSGDLYYNDGAGNHVRITQSGAVAGTPGSISNLTSPASAAYSAATQTFIWQSAASTPANLDAASLVLRNLTASSKGLTLNPPNAMGADFALTLPSIPGQQNFMTLDASGNMAASWNVDNSTLEVSSNSVRVKAAGIGTAQIATQSITQALLAARATGTTVAAGGVAISATCGNFSTTSGSAVQIPNFSVTITTTGRPVMIMIMSGYYTSPTSCNATVAYYKNGSPMTYNFQHGSPSSGTTIPCGQFIIDTPTAGTYTYSVLVGVPFGTFVINNAYLVAFEM